MKKPVNTPYEIRSVAQFHQLMQLPPCAHPLISIVNFESIKHLNNVIPKSFQFGFYSIWLKKNFQGKMKYGQNDYDFDEGIMSFFSPGQVITNIPSGELNHSGWWLIIHPDFLWNFPLAKVINNYGFFSYAVHEALHLSEQEEQVVSGIMESIKNEISSRMDNFSQRVIISQIELLLNYADRFYHRQFITRRIVNHDLLSRLDELLNDYFDSGKVSELGLPAVQYLSDKLHISPNYLSDLLRTQTGQSTQQHIHNKLIEKAKLKLSTTKLSISEIAYELGFEHSQSFSKLFKSKTNLSPGEFRHSFN